MKTDTVQEQHDYKATVENTSVEDTLYFSVLEMNYQ